MRTSWQRRSEWFGRTFKPINKVCRHPAERLMTCEANGLREIRCLDCGEITARQMKP